MTCLAASRSMDLLLAGSGLDETEVHSGLDPEHICEAEKRGCGRPRGLAAAGMIISRCGSLVGALSPGFCDGA